MSSSGILEDAVQNWAEIYMRRSMSSFIRFAREAGLSMQQFGILFHLHRESVLGITEMAGDFGVSCAAASQMIDRMVQQGLLERREDPQDRRGKQIALAPRGAELVERAMRARQEWVEELITQLDPERAAAIAASLEALSHIASHTSFGKVTTDYTEFTEKSGKSVKSMDHTEKIP